MTSSFLEDGAFGAVLSLLVSATLANRIAPLPLAVFIPEVLDVDGIPPQTGVLMLELQGNALGLDGGGCFRCLENFKGCRHCPL